MKTPENIRRIIVTAVAGALLLSLYFVIFNFSAQNGEESSSLSLKISAKCVDVLQSLSGGGWSKAKLIQLTEALEHPIRKLAHFSEYACMGVLVFVLWDQWMKRGRRLYLLSIVWVAVSAAADEIHQLFVPDRYGSFADVCLDVCGGAFGMLFCIVLGKMAGRAGRKRRKRKDKVQG